MRIVSAPAPPAAMQAAKAMAPTAAARAARLRIEREAPVSRILSSLMRAANTRLRAETFRASVQGNGIALVDHVLRVERALDHVLAAIPGDLVQHVLEIESHLRIHIGDAALHLRDRLVEILGNYR